MPRRDITLSDKLGTIQGRRRRERQRNAEQRAERERIMAELTPQTAAETIGFYRTQKAIAMQRWQERGTVAPPTSGRHPRVFRTGRAL